jgi:dTMP kinase
MKKRGRFIVLEGIDGSGKNTQFRLLQKRLKKEGHSLLVADFPRYYDSKWGKLVGRFLAGEFGSLKSVNPYLAVLLYMLDEYTWTRETGTPWIEKGGLILSNRYFTSNVHQIAKLRTSAQKKYRDWLWPAGYKDLGILKPDLVIFVDTSPDVAKELVNFKEKRAYLKKQKKDIAEKNWNHQVAAYREYKRTVKANRWWVEVPGVKDSQKDYKKEIHENIWKIVSAKVLSK